jgi:hypothetical protein
MSKVIVLLAVVVLAVAGGASYFLLIDDDGVDDVPGMIKNFDLDVKNLTTGEILSERSTNYIDAKVTESVTPIIITEPASATVNIISYSVGTYAHAVIDHANGKVTIKDTARPGDMITYTVKLTQKINGSTYVKESSAKINVLNTAVTSFQLDAENTTTEMKLSELATGHIDAKSREIIAPIVAAEPSYAVIDKVEYSIGTYAHATLDQATGKVTIKDTARPGDTIAYTAKLTQRINGVTYTKESTITILIEETKAESISITRWTGNDIVEPNEALKFSAQISPGHASYQNVTWYVKQGSATVQGDTGQSWPNACILRILSSALDGETIVLAAKDHTGDVESEYTLTVIHRLRITLAESNAGTIGVVESNISEVILSFGSTLATRNTLEGYSLQIQERDKDLTIHINNVNLRGYAGKPVIYTTGSVDYGVTMNISNATLFGSNGGTGYEAQPAINIPKLVMNVRPTVDLFGGNGVNGSSGVAGKNGAPAISSTESVVINLLVAQEPSILKITGGNGGNGYNATNTSDNGTNGGNGGAGVAAGYITIVGNPWVTGGNGGNGGNGADGGRDGNHGTSGGRGGNGGNGGNPLSITVGMHTSSMSGMRAQATYGDGGNGGNGGRGGDSNEGSWLASNGGNGGNAGNGGSGAVPGTAGTAGAGGRGGGVLTSGNAGSRGNTGTNGVAMSPLL